LSNNKNKINYKWDILVIVFEINFFIFFIWIKIIYKYFDKICFE
jgi:hypothetical protein